VRPVDWDELAKLCESENCVHDRTGGDHIVMVRPGMARPVVFPRKKDLREDIVFGVARTLGISKKDLRIKLGIDGSKSKKKKARSVTNKAKA
jgi:HicA-like toxin of HicAB toxin-antitoxin system